MASRGNELRIKTAPTTNKKEKEKQPDKLEKYKRLEKEKKALAKREGDLSKNTDKTPIKPVKHPKRTGNINYTTQYENGEIEDYDEYDYI